MTQQPMYLGVDGGGTSCRARLCAADGRLLGEGFAGGANPRLGLDFAYANIMLATRQALTAANLDDEALPYIHAGFGLAGVAQKKERELVLNHPHPFADLALLTDAHTACLGAFNGANGGILIMGTGSCAVATIDHEFHLLGGWGFPVSDCGSGAWLGLNTLRHSLLAFERLQPASALTDAVMQRFDNNQENVVAWMDQAKPRDYAAFVPLVFEHARLDDPVATQLLAKTADEAALMIRGLINLGAPAVCIMGGLSEAIVPWLPRDITPYLTSPLGDALDGAILLIKQKSEISEC
ncbi:BadF/BadG/BcrA/BcrD ATPase family protein [Hahella sp. HN01]|uniref:BadF/BadG/BcrA/BcrD ATPase family protein n=1 Tax=Hahella sp. HN01 TaxID=2847262 RepID=UPI0035304FD1